MISLTLGMTALAAMSFRMFIPASTARVRSRARDGTHGLDIARNVEADAGRVEVVLFLFVEILRDAEEHSGDIDPHR